MAVWTKGPAVAPYIKALKELRPVVLIVATARKGRIHQYRAGNVTAVKTAHARAHPGKHPHMGGPRWSRRSPSLPPSGWMCSAE